MKSNGAKKMKEASLKHPHQYSFMLSSLIVRLTMEKYE